MNEKYKALFAAVAQAMETTAEQAMEMDKTKGDMQAYKTAKEMRAKYARLHDLLTSKTVNYVLTKNDYIELFIGATIVSTNIEARIKKLQTALAGYHTELLPKLQKIVDMKEDETLDSLVAELFSISEESNN